MSTKGLTTVATFDRGVTFSDEWVDLVYESLEKTITVVSVDLLLDEEAATMTVTLGIQCSEGFDADSLTEVISRDAIELAIRHANGDDRMDTAAFPIIMPGLVEQFA